MRTIPAAALGLAAVAFSLSPHVLAQPKESVQTEAGALGLETVVDGLVHPWGMAFLPNGQLLITEREGRLRLLSQEEKLSDPLEGVPEVFNQGQGGLLDVALHPDFESNQQVYLSFSEPGDGGATTALGRARLNDNRLEDFEVVFRMEPRVEHKNHFGGRIVFADDGTLFLTLAERFQFDPAQDLSNHLGTVVRLNDDGTPADGNPFLDDAEARDEIWSYGHRNIESAALHPETGELWIAEFGPLGGDELNRPEAGRNYGWPEVSWGKHYDGEDIPDPSDDDGYADSVKQWTPVISPSGMAFYTGDTLPEWQGSMLIGGLSEQGLVRITLDGEAVTNEERIPLGARIRDVELGPDGLVYVLTDEANGKLIRLAPLEDDSA
ncbi:PQQ-dependent sugar dehydrogenase [Billgrantia diversa]|uniref:PQQ-dependent sugar dehydrogenase n=1 Tax=Halomonas sp. MCCC 1A13316 TaxID=2733487 RepID=UPI0018A3968F|nr:PQQ-dependent sugar dehydrogenase [Halomonas sp. MCCC 1A13316]QOR38037.1 PQQ-dependent sugar dehydrogenase [Halomonas sp. MCCC 1A13316]